METVHVHLWEYSTKNIGTVIANFREHPSQKTDKKYYDTGSMALACTAGECDVVDLTDGGNENG